MEFTPGELDTLNILIEQGIAGMIKTYSKGGNDEPTEEYLADVVYTLEDLKEDTSLIKYMSLDILHGFVYILNHIMEVEERDLTSPAATLGSKLVDVIKTRININRN